MTEDQADQRGITVVTVGVRESNPERGPFDGQVDLDRDRRLVQRAQDGDKAAFDLLYESYFARLERYCLRRLHDPHEAQDIAQESFLRAWRALSSFGGDRRFYPWLSVIASNLCTDSLRRKRRFGPVPVAEFRGSEVSAGESAEDSVLALAEMDLAARAFRQLSDRHRRVLYLREQSGLSYQAIADQEGLRVTTVETLIWRARRALRREFIALSGSDGVLGGVVVAGAARPRILSRLLRKVGRVSTRLVSTSPRGLMATLGGAAASAAIVVASLSGGPHALKTRGSDLPEQAFSSAAAPRSGLARPVPVGASHLGHQPAPLRSAAATPDSSAGPGNANGNAPPSDPSTVRNSVAPPSTTSPTTRVGDPGRNTGSGSVPSVLGGVGQNVTSDVGNLLHLVDGTVGSAAQVVRKVDREVTRAVTRTVRSAAQAAEDVDGEASKTIASTLGSLDIRGAGATTRGGDSAGSGLLGGLLG